MPIKKALLLTLLLAISSAAIRLKAEAPRLTARQSNQPTQKSSPPPDIFNSNSDQSQVKLKGGVQQNVVKPDPLHCFYDAWSSVRNSLGAYQLALNGVLNSSFACHADAKLPDLEPCWVPLQQAKSLMEQAAQLYERALRGPDPSGRINSQANKVNLQSRPYLDQADDCYQPIYKKWFDDYYSTDGPGRKSTLPPNVLLPPSAPPPTNLPGPLPSPYHPIPPKQVTPPSQTPAQIVSQCVDALGRILYQANCPQSAGADELLPKVPDIDYTCGKTQAEEDARYDKDYQRIVSFQEQVVQQYGAQVGDDYLKRVDDQLREVYNHHRECLSRLGLPPASSPPTPPSAGSPSKSQLSPFVLGECMNQSGETGAPHESATLDPLWLQWCVGWRGLLEEKVWPKLTVAFPDIRCAFHGLVRFSQTPYGVSVQLSSYTYTCANTQSAARVPKLLAKVQELLLQLNPQIARDGTVTKQGQVPPFPVGTHITSLERSLDLGLGLPATTGVQ
jgi:hypothetical protein